MTLLVFLAYFIQAYINHLNFIDDLKYIQSTLPVFMDRFRYMMLLYGMNRERLVMNNSLTSFEWFDGYGYNGDAYYKDQSILNEKRIIDIKTNYRKPMESMVNFINDIDSPLFCPKVIVESLDTLDKELKYQP